ncbi:hypothetical protein Tco_0113281 [Tanacetum coccineum]
MAQQQHAADVHPDELCPLNKRYDLMDSNKKVDLDHVQSSTGIYNRVKDTIEFQDYWSSATMANVMQNILQMPNNTCHWMGPTTGADNANAVFFVNNIYVDYAELL